jgi:hypothetical protein
MGEWLGLAQAMHLALTGEKAILFLPTTEVRLIDPPKDLVAGYGLQELKDLLGFEQNRYIEIVTLIREVSRMVVDDEGALVPLKINNPATYLYRNMGGMSPIYGPALVTPWSYIK